MNTPQLPPLFRPESVPGRADPFERACALAVAGSDPGIVAYNISREKLRAAIVFTPEVALEEAMAMLPACGIGFQYALGSLAPPEVAVHLEWDGAIRVNNARCGNLKAAASTADPTIEPEWLVIGLDLDLQHSDDAPGNNPEYTALTEEGCVEVEPIALLEAWVRHTLNWINRWSEEGAGPLLAEWRGLAHGLGETVEIFGRKGLFVGIDEKFGALVRDSKTTDLISLSSLLKK